MVMGSAVTGAGMSLAVAQDSAPVCAPGQPPVVINGSAGPSEAKTYRLVPFEVADGTTRVEVGYSWADSSPLPSTPLTQSVVDLGLWDADGTTGVDAFRGWSGSRQGKVGEGQDPVFVQADSAERGYYPGPIEPGVWHVELGIAAVGPNGLTYEVTVTCSDVATGAAFEPDPVDPAHVASSEPGWYAGDFHMHGYHSNPSAPPFDDGDPSDVDSFVDFARAAGLDFTPVTDYVTTQHHGELGPVQRDNPDLVIWPGREIITYFGHATVFGETPSVIEYRHGLDDITLGQIQADTVADGALFGVAHPTIFPGPLFANFCRGCEFTLGGDIDWSLVDTIEVLTGPILVDDTELGGPGAGLKIQNPFVQSAIELWEDKLLEGFAITAVSGSDDKLGPDLGSSATQVYAEELSRPALIEGIRAGHAYVQTMGTTDSPTLSMTATGDDGSTAMMGGTVVGDSATVTVTVEGAANQLLQITRDGDVVDLVPITGDSFTHTFEAERVSGSGPLGTFYRVDTLQVVGLDQGVDGPVLTAISNPIFIRPTPAEDDPAPDDQDPGDSSPEDGDPPVAPAEATSDAELPRTGRSASLMLALAAVVAALALRRRRWLPRN